MAETISTPGREVDIQFTIGADEDVVFEVRDAYDDTVAVDVSGWTFSLIVKRRREDPDAKALFEVTSTTTAGTFDSDASVNAQRVTAPVTASLTAGLAPGAAYYECRRNDSGYKRPIAYGRFDLVLGAHRS